MSVAPSTGSSDDEVTVYVTRPTRALAFDFEIELPSEHRALGEYFEWLFASFTEATGPAERFVVRDRTDDEGLELMGGDTVEVSSTGPGNLVTNVVHWLNRRAINTELAVTCHAGGVARDGVGYVLPAEMESGKTTLTTGLVRMGFSYLTDEAVAFEPETGLIDPFPKPLSIDAGSHFLFPELEPPPAPGETAAPEDQWQVPVDMIRADAGASPCRAGYVVFPRYEEGATTTMEPLRRAEALVELAKNTFAFRERARHSLDTLSTVIGDADCFRLTVGDLDAACALIDALPARPAQANSESRARA